MKIPKKPDLYTTLIPIKKPADSGKGNESKVGVKMILLRESI